MAIVVAGLLPDKPDGGYVLRPERFAGRGSQKTRIQNLAIYILVLCRTGKDNLKPVMIVHSFIFCTCSKQATWKFFGGAYYFDAGAAFRFACRLSVRLSAAPI
jgi:hypothetical protein